MPREVRMCGTMQHLCVVVTKKGVYEDAGKRLVIDMHSQFKDQNLISELLPSMPIKTIQSMKIAMIFIFYFFKVKSWF